MSRLKVSESPWTEEQVAALQQWQESPHVHPYTCANRSYPGHEWRDGDRDTGVLVPTESGFVCRDCGRIQVWCYTFSFDPIPDPFADR